MVKNYGQLEQLIKEQILQVMGSNVENEVIITEPIDDGYKMSISFDVRDLSGTRTYGLILSDDRTTMTLTKLLVKDPFFEFADSSFIKDIKKDINGQW